ncbi:MAG: tRNA guanosine(34) transglycosylase Tgt [Nanoarchaeota archaeon]
MFKVLYEDKEARIGELKVGNKKVETPFFMPVATKMTVKYINSVKLNEMQVNAVISNAFILSMRPGSKFVKKIGGIGKFMNFKGINFSDSGGFQMYSKSIYHKSNDNGIYFRNPYSGEKIFMTPEENMKIQLNLGSDVAMCLDSMPMYEESYEDIRKSVNKTIEWAKKCKIVHDKLNKNNQLLFGISQGGKYEDLREECIRELIKLNFDGYSIGGFGLGETKEEEFKIIKLHRKMISKNKPIYLMGIGDPVEILEAINLGCDIFDSRMPTQNARRGSLFTDNGKLRILKKDYESDKNPIDKRCNCFVCKNYNRSYIRYLLKEDESVGKELASYHNIYFLNNLIKDARTAIKNKKFYNFLKNFKKRYKI